MQYILIADDNKDITDVLAAYVRKEGYDAVVAENGKQAVEYFEKYVPAAVLLDIMMPEMDGYEVCKQLRAISNVPILLITARGEDYERIMGLDIGADDYIVKPFSPGEVMARLRAVLRRMNKNDTMISSENVLAISNLVINIDEYMVYIDGDPVSLTKKEIETMYALAGHPNKVFTRDNLLDSLWGYDFFGDSRTIDSHIKRIRAKIDKYSHPDWHIKTVWGVGYKFEMLDSK